MASTQKKTANTKKQTTGKKPNGTRKKPPAYVPDLMARGIGAAVCLFLALMVVLGMVGIHAVVPDLLCRGIRGLVGYGFWLTALALFWRRACCCFGGKGGLPCGSGAWACCRWWAVRSSMCCSRPGSLPWGLIWQAGSGTMGSMALAAV